MNATSFIYDNINSNTYDLLICRFSSNSMNNISSIGEIEVTTDKAAYSSKWNHFSTSYSKPLEFTFQFTKKTFQKFSTYEQATINRWLMNFDEYKWLQFNEPDYMHILYNAKCTKLEKIEIGNVCFGFEVTFTTDSSYGYSNEIKKHFTISQVNQNECITNSSDEIYYLYPKITIAVNKACDFSIINTYTDEKTELKGCLNGEIITLDSETRIITSNKRNAIELFEAFNWTWFRLGISLQNRKNNLVFNGNASVDFTYREIRKVGI
ncbi:phage tail domain-containing protein [Anaerosporobacter sp.]|uniref:phage tail domain-containing protein n=1 Tax=Anaerosporobacter sp. TaxID=1872529 RepID=UPI00286F7007|nr:phage tail domain-containing protein [Anaerosporobacter sp.]